MKISEAKKKFTEHIIEGELATEAKKAISIFAPNKNVYRHIPFISDGLLPSERRVLYAMYKDVNALPKGNYKKLGLIIGAVMKYHPHGETNIYKTCVKLARPWKNAVEFIDGSGSYGNEMGKGASAFRYLEAKLSLFSLYCYFKDFDEAIVPMKDGYIDEITEPEYLPARYPAVLTKSCKAIGYGMYSEQPNYNFTEICEFVLKLMDNPDYDAIIYPDIPNGCEIIDDGQFDDIRRTGKGKFRMKSKANIDYENNKIEVLSVPMNTDLQQIKDKVIAMGKSGELVGYVDIHDQNDKRNGKKKRKKNSKEQAKLSIDILFKEGTDLDKALELLYKKTPMLTSAAYDLTLVDEYKLKEYTIRTLLLDWLSFRRDVKRRQINKQITKKTERVHVLDILIFISNTKNSKTTIELATKAYDVREFREMIMTEFGISTLQAASIGNMQITSFNKSAHEKYVVERDKLKEEIEKLMSLVKSSKKIDDIIKDELREGIELFGRPRKSNVVKFDLNNNYIADTDHRIVITKNDMIKKLGKRNTGIGELEEGDKVIHYAAVSEDAESKYICDTIQKITQSGVSESHIAVLYRANYLSRSIEQEMIRRQITYKIFGGLKLFNRNEVKDALSYIRLVVMGDDLSFERVVNTPSRGIGAKTLEKITLTASRHGISNYEAVCFFLDETGVGGKAKKGLKELVEVIEKARVSDKSLADIYEDLLKDTGYLKLMKDGQEDNRIENLMELKNSIDTYVNTHPETPDFESYLQDIALYTSQDEEKTGDYVSLMSIHMAKDRKSVV